MSESRIESIEQWFGSQEDGEFCAYPASHVSTRVGDSATASTLIYTTKHHCLSRISGITGFQQPIATIARYGLPTINDLPFVRGSSPTLARIFIGDADPPDILVFCWLREHLPIVWHGVNDDFLDRHGNRDYRDIHIRMSDAEQQTAGDLSRFCPDYRDLVGEYCSSLLADGFKIELEGAIIDRNEKTEPA